MASSTEVEPYLGGEKNLLEPDVEKKGVEDILAALDEDEKAAMPDPSMPIRHFRAEKGDVAKAITKLKETLEWRKSFETDELVKASGENDDSKFRELMERENSTGKIYIRGYDKEGRAFMYMRPAREQTNHEADNMKHLVWHIEKAIACTARKSKELGAEKPLEKIIFITDYEGFSLSNAPPMSTSKLTLHILQNHYPERLYRAYVNNPPFVFKAFWTVIKPFVDPVTKEKICFLTGKNALQPLHDSAENVEHLEPAVGGTATKEFVSKDYLSLPFDVGFDE